MPFTQDPNSSYGPLAAIVQGDLTIEDCDSIAARNITHIAIESAADLSNLAKIPGLTVIDVLAKTPVNVSPIAELASLKRLRLGGNWFGHLSLAALGELQHFGGQLNRPRSSVSGFHHAKNLNHLSGNFSEKNLLEIAECPCVRSMEVSLTRFTSLGWLRPMQRLEALALTQCASLQKLDDLSELKSLRYLKFRDCRKIFEVEWVTSISDLEVLQLDECGAVESINPVMSCKSLRLLSMLGDTKILDGRLSVLKMHPALESVRFVNRKIYDCRAEEFCFVPEDLKKAYLRYFT